VLAAPGADGKRLARIRIDGKKPSEFAEAYRITRPAPGPWSPLTVTRVDREAPLRLEEWTLKVTSVGADSASWTYDVAGSVTGPDGGGESAKPFLSKSGRVRIDPEAFFRNGNVPNGYEIKWRVLPMFVDVYEPPAVADASREHATTLVQGLANGRHTLEITAEDGGAPIRAVRIYRPPVK